MLTLEDIDECCEWLERWLNNNCSCEEFDRLNDKFYNLCAVARMRLEEQAQDKSWVEYREKHMKELTDTKQDLVTRLRTPPANISGSFFTDRLEAADRIEELEAECARKGNEICILTEGNERFRQKVNKLEKGNFPFWSSAQYESQVKVLKKQLDQARKALETISSYADDNHLGFDAQEFAQEVLADVSLEDRWEMTVKDWQGRLDQANKRISELVGALNRSGVPLPEHGKEPTQERQLSCGYYDDAAGIKEYGV